MTIFWQSQSQEVSNTILLGPCANPKIAVSVAQDNNLSVQPLQKLDNLLLWKKSCTNMVYISHYLEGFSTISGGAGVLPSTVGLVDQPFLQIHRQKEMGVSKNDGTPKSSNLIGCSIINHPFWGTPIFGNIQIQEPLHLQTSHRDQSDIVWCHPQFSAL